MKKDSYYYEDGLSRYYKDIRKFILPEDEEAMYLKKYIETKDQDAFDKVFFSNLRLVVFIARGYYQSVKDNTTMSIEDLIQEGNIGLCSAITNYDEEKGAFSAYATATIKGTIQNYLTKDIDLVSAPDNVKSQYRKIRAEILSHKRDDDKNTVFSKDDMDKAGKSLGFSDTQVYNAWLYQMSKYPLSLNYTIGKEDEDDDLYLQDLIEDKKMISPEKEYEKKDLLTRIDKAMDRILTDREKQILSGNAGLHGNIPKSKIQLSEELGITKQCTGQIYKKAIRKMKNDKNFRKEIEDYREM